MTSLVGQAAQGAGAVLTGLVESLRNLTSTEEERRQVAFTVAMIGLSAKMAKADGVVTHDEIEAFRDLVEFPAQEAQNVARLYNLAKQDVAGFDAYARKIATLFEDEDAILEDILDGLFHIAMADGVLHDREGAYLETVAAEFGFDDVEYCRVRARHVFEGEVDPYIVLGVEPDLPFEDIRKTYRKLVAENHPDRLIARGVPAEFIKIASERLATINAAFDQIELRARTV
ncbi:MAG: DnaJ family molecular chaperone [Devosiaceae bacterium]|nr:DnaJ family molecular chaperone [Devosiaceae bacterium MH13]